MRFPGAIVPRRPHNQRSARRWESRAYRSTWSAIQLQHLAGAVKLDDSARPDGAVAPEWIVSNVTAMRDITELSEHEAELMNRLIAAYPVGCGYAPDVDPPVHEVAKELIKEGRVERKEIDESEVQMISYRLTSEYAEEIGRAAREKAEGADWN